jgi:hypothetical protein
VKHGPLEEEMKADWKCQRCGFFLWYVAVQYILSGTRRGAARYVHNWVRGSWTNKYTKGRKIGWNIYRGYRQEEL